jgi:DNA-binding beta-propeller fold protein YncE
MPVQRTALLGTVFVGVLLGTTCQGRADGSHSRKAVDAAQTPLVLDAELALPGAATRFDYQDIDSARGHLIVAHMNDDAVLVIDLPSRTVVAQLNGIRRARGVCVADSIGVIFVTSLPNRLVVIDAKSLKELRRVVTGDRPDGVAWDPLHAIVAVSDQGDGALSLIADGGSGKRTQLRLGTETGNVAFDATRGWFWITVVAAQRGDQLVAVDPRSGTQTISIALPGCRGAHGLRLHPDARSAFVACEDNAVLARVELTGEHHVVSAATGNGPDVLSIDPSLGWLYVAAESGDLSIFDIKQPALVAIGRTHVAEHAHSVVIDPATHRAFFPLPAGTRGTPVLRIMRPAAASPSNLTE